MFHHDFIVDNYTVLVRGDVSTLEAFARICHVPAHQFMVSGFVMNFLGATSLDCKRLDKLPRPASGTVGIVQRPMGPLPDMHAIQATQSHAHALYLRHEHVVPVALLQTWDRLQPGALWSMVALRQHKDGHLPVVDYSLTNSNLLLQKAELVAAQVQ